MCDEDLRDYDYREAVTEDIMEYVRDNYKGCSRPSESVLYDALFCDDSVTGNGSGSYFFSTHRSMLAVMGSMNLLREACSEFGCMEELGEKLCNDDWEWADVTIRCYMLGQCLGDALGRLDDEGFFDGDDEDEDDEGSDDEDDED